MQILPRKQTVWTRLSLTHRANITKQLFCFQLATSNSAKKVKQEPKEPFFVSNLNQAANGQESDRIASWKIWGFFGRERPISHQFDVFL